ncbi:conserved hypothetical protein [Methanococcus vannielii SB]|uniref:SSD domain-containing protein n=1 Tax=Methanococcus vannielii (strain ATCC 35089 / DSM 1224 / JCM 13029 / OCM 148 / SB) TaxID=406327 RepID=A6UNY4_METVS|nr:MMPL family transporter [Methanococcus vannielii]ABR54206.1 conserved hypothetical protein [Methanococcus vannielii SB]
MINEILSKIAKSSINRPFLVLSIVFIFTLLMAGLLPNVKSQTDYEKMVPQDDPVIISFNKVRDNFGGSEIIMVGIEVVPSNSPEKVTDIRDPRVLELIDFLKKDLVSIGDVNSVYSPTDKIVVENNDIIPKDIQKVRTIYQNLPESSKNGIYSSDYSMALVHVTTDVSSDKQEELVKEINLRLKEAPIPPGIQVITTGSPAIGELMGRLMAESQAITGIAALLAIFTILYLYFKSFVKSVLPLIPVGCAIIWAAGSMAIFGIPMDMATSIMGSLLLGLGIDYGVHVYHRYEEELKKGSSLNEAIETTVITTGSAVVTTTATTVAGFAALTIAPLPMMSNMGKVCALGIFFCMAAVISILPSLIIIEERHLRPTIKKLKMQLKGDSNE